MTDYLSRGPAPVYDLDAARETKNEESERLATLERTVSTNDQTVLNDLRERLLNAYNNLLGLFDEREGFAADRLMSKAEGVALALSYLDEALR